MVSTIAAVAIGGALGASLRYGVNEGALKLLGADFPWATLGVNVIGSFAIGMAYVISAGLQDLSPELRAFLITGFLGAFTTFSAFSLDAFLLWDRDLTLQAVAYVFGSVILSIGAFLIPVLISRALLS